MSHAMTRAAASAGRHGCCRCGVLLPPWPLARIHPHPCRPVAYQAQPLGAGNRLPSQHPTTRASRGPRTRRTPPGAHDGPGLLLRRLQPRPLTLQLGLRLGSRRLGDLGGKGCGGGGAGGPGMQGTQTRWGWGHDACGGRKEQQLPRAGCSQHHNPLPCRQVAWHGLPRHAGCGMAGCVRTDMQAPDTSDASC